MSDDVAESLHGYLNKEKSKTRFLRGLGGDVNRRYFRVQKIQVRVCCTYGDVNCTIEHRPL